MSFLLCHISSSTSEAFSASAPLSVRMRTCVRAFFPNKRAPAACVRPGASRSAPGPRTRRGARVRLAALVWAP
eukprot:5459066-Lingulodinium_polyedra.AAC.1